MRDNELNERKKMILKAIIEAHVRDGGPVGSKSLTEGESIHLSPATIRNEMAELEEMGYLEQPHTSAGRIPSESGYRLYVNSLMQKYDMTTAELSKLSSLAKTKLAEVDKLLDAATKMAAYLTNYSSIAVRTRGQNGTVDSFRLVPLADGSLMLIAVSNGNVKTKQLITDVPVSAEILSRTEAVLNEMFTGKSLDEITMSLVMEAERELEPDGAVLQTVVKAICEMLDGTGESEVKLSGVNHLLEYPEYSDISEFRDLLSVLEDKRDILKLVDETPDREEEAQVIIGSESDVEEMKNSSLVIRKIKRNGKVVGAIGVIGPRRMDYSRVITTVDYIAENLETLLCGHSMLGDGGASGKGQK